MSSDDLPYLPHRVRRVSCRRLALLCLTAWLLGGCGGDQPATPAADEHWYTFLLGGVRVGHLHNRTEQQAKEGRQWVHAWQEMDQSVERFGQPFQTKLALHSLEAPDGQLLTFEAAGSLGSETIAMRGRVADGQLLVEGAAAPIPIGGDGKLGGFLAVEQSLARQPLQPGEKRTVRKIDWIPSLGAAVSNVELAAADYEQVEIRGGQAELLRLTQTLHLSNSVTLQQTCWSDRQGRIVKMTFQGGQELLKCAKTEATKPLEGKPFDVGYATAVPITGPARGLATARRVTYRVRLKQLDPAKVFARGTSQQVRSLDAQTAEIVVRALRPDTPGVTDESRPTQADLSPNELIESNDEVIVSMARQVAPQEKDAWKLAKALEWHVKKSIKQATFSAALDSAAKVARTLEGDCTEHAMLLAGLARARGLPARVAIGLVESGNSFAFHMWTEVYVADRWLALDATRAQGGISAAYLKLTDTNLAGQVAGLANLLRVAEVLGQFERLEVLEIE